MDLQEQAPMILTSVILLAISILLMGLQILAQIIFAGM